MIKVNKELELEINKFNQKSKYVAQIRILGPALKSLHGHLFDPSDWKWEDVAGTMVDHDTNNNVAICVVEILLNGELCYTSPKQLVVYHSDREYLQDSCDEALKHFLRQAEGNTRE